MIQPAISEAGKLPADSKACVNVTLPRWLVTMLDGGQIKAFQVAKLAYGE